MSESRKYIKNYKNRDTGEIIAAYFKSMCPKKRGIIKKQLEKNYPFDRKMYGTIATNCYVSIGVPVRIWSTKSFKKQYKLIKE